MEEEEVSDILIEITKEFVKPENLNKLEEQKLASSIFYSFVLGVLNNDEYENEKIEDIVHAVRWLQENSKLIKNFGVQ